MAEIEIFLKDGSRMSENVKVFDSKLLASQFNSPQLLLIKVGGVYINKNAVRMVLPVNPAETANCRVAFQNGTEITTFVEDFAGLNENLNNLKVVMSVIGDVMIDKREIKLVSPIKTQTA
jgi:hypothetical protein